MTRPVLVTLLTVALMTWVVMPAMTRAARRFLYPATPGVRTAEAADPGTGSAAGSGVALGQPGTPEG